MLLLKAMNDTAELLRAWVEHGSEDAFAKLVARHIDLVYSVAVRKVAGDSGLAADIAQTVFADLARKARSLRAEGSLAGWLHRHTCHIAATALRGELRRRAREQTAAAMHALEHPTATDPDWPRLAPLLDDAVDALDETDRRAILLRFYEQRDLRSVGSALGVGDDAAQKRVSRALEKLRGWLARRGVTSSVAALATVLGTHSVAAAPAGLAAAVTSATLATAAATVGAGTFTLFEIMTHLKAKLAVTAAVAAAVATPLVWQENVIAKNRDENRALAARIESFAQVRAEPTQPVAAPATGDDAAGAREREDLERLRNEVAALRAQLQQARAARLAAGSSIVSVGKSPLATKPGYISIQDAREVGNATPEALFQSFLWAFRTGDTNRIIALGDWSAEGGREEIEKMAREVSKAMASAEFEKESKDLGFRIVRQIQLEDGDSAVVMEVGKGADSNRMAMRARRTGNEWRLVMGKGGPQEVKLTDEQMGD